MENVGCVGKNPKFRKIFTKKKKNIANFGFYPTHHTLLKRHTEMYV
jgi:hypothetical protein